MSISGPLVALGVVKSPPVLTSGMESDTPAWPAVWIGLQATVARQNNFDNPSTLHIFILASKKFHAFLVYQVN